MKHKFLGYVALAFVLFFIITNPTGAAGTANHLGAGLASAATSLGDFFTALTAGGR
ncbi:hypothetical protein [Planosporangium mesophilum]|uniref:Secreted protein n=1 Tax=Planosporangium mesophilum TaxID=689768 RepID=A0A8J3TGH0_9ACTN|nr:hypothetical protein [Planosporangium mesophilum]NJC86806.1 hypothetical protein [Planosporangium mesophilum]GII26513.1 hypothetical protein Pme01_61100 [Planosporangium mesophilum]